MGRARAWIRGHNAVGLMGALALHGAMLGVLFAADPPRPQLEPRRPPVRISLQQRQRPAVEKPEPKAPPVEKPEEKKVEKKVEKKPPPKKRKPRPNKKPAKRVDKKIAKKEPVERPAKAPAEAAPEVDSPPSPSPSASADAPAPPVRKFTVSMEATVSSGGVAVPTAPAGQAWAYGSADGAADAPRALGGRPDGVPGGTGDGAGRPLRAAEVTSLPELIDQPPAGEMRALYPAAARRDGIEADVKLRILVSARGEVVRVRLLRPAGAGFDDAARKLVQRFRFRPGQRDGRPVAVWIPWTYKFRLDG
jgi:TonB family protein